MTNRHEEAKQMTTEQSAGAASDSWASTKFFAMIR
jgi:hypothetical protein